MSFGLVLGMLFVAISNKMGSVECIIKTVEDGRYVVSVKEEIMPEKERFLENFGFKWDEIRKVFQGIYPGTKWCGAGSVATNDNDFGTSVETDMCCKEHDGCKTYITAFGSDYGLTNYAPYTVSGCDCDELFLNCTIDVANSETATADDRKTAFDFGAIFFNGISPKCLKADYPLVCVKKGWLGLTCKEYQPDTSKDKVWHLVNGPKFRSK